jgi:hypothetical protein
MGTRLHVSYVDGHTTLFGLMNDNLQSHAISLRRYITVAATLSQVLPSTGEPGQDRRWSSVAAGLAEHLVSRDSVNLDSSEFSETAPRHVEPFALDIGRGGLTVRSRESMTMTRSSTGRDSASSMISLTPCIRTFLVEMRSRVARCAARFLRAARRAQAARWTMRRAESSVDLPISIGRTSNGAVS